MSIPVICDRCRSTGIAGEADFSHLGDLLEFEPVPRKTRRADGWSAERQRAFIAALSATGSKRRAAQSIGMAPFGVDQLLKAEGSDSFKAAVDRAMAIAGKNGSMRIAQGVADAAARNAQLTPPSRLRGLPAPLAEEGTADIPEDEKWRLVENLAARFMKKVAAEREARLNGEIVAADFYLRQITMLEVLFDLTATKFGWNPREVLRELRRGDRSILEIVSRFFPMSTSVSLPGLARWRRSLSPAARALLPRLPCRIAGIARGLQLFLRLGSGCSRLGGGILCRRFIGGLAFGLLRRRLLRLGGLPLLPGRHALRGEFLVDRRARAILLQRLLLGLGGLGGAVLE